MPSLQISRNDIMTSEIETIIENHTSFEESSYGKIYNSFGSLGGITISKDNIAASGFHGTDGAFGSSRTYIKQKDILKRTGDVNDFYNSHDLHYLNMNAINPF